MSLPRHEGRDLASVNSDQILYAEDLAVGDWMDLGPVEVTRDEIIRFAQRNSTRYPSTSTEPNHRLAM